MNKKAITRLEKKVAPDTDIEVPMFGTMLKGKLYLSLSKELVDILRAQGLTDKDIISEKKGIIEIAIDTKGDLIESYNKETGVVFIKGFKKQYILVMEVNIVDSY